MVTRTLISRKTWRLIRDNLIQSQVNQTDRGIVRLTLNTNGQETFQRSVRQVKANLNIKIIFACNNNYLNKGHFYQDTW